MSQEKETLSLLNPYAVFETPNGYGFVTESDTKYHLSFIQVPSDYPLFSFSIEREDRVDKVYPYDKRIKDTVIYVLQIFFESEYNALLYTCDITEGLHYARFKLFSIWYLEFKDTYYREDYCIGDIRSAVITRRDNPLIKEIKQIFLDLQTATTEEE